MEVCEFKGKVICAYDVTNINYVLNYELKKEWKIAGKNGELKCPECGKEVILKINDPRKVIPHFAHRISDDRCEFRNNGLRESEEHKRGKMLLYHYFKKLYPEEKLMIDHRFENKRRSDLYIEFNDGNRVAIEYQRTNLDIVDWQERQDEYSKLNIKTVWLLKEKEEDLKVKEKQVEVPFFQQVMLNELDKTAKFLDVINKKFIFVKNMTYKDKHNSSNTYDEMFVMSYNMEDIIIKSDGTIECDFLSRYDKENERFIKEHSNRCELQEKEKSLEIEKNKLRELDSLKSAEDEINKRIQLSKKNLSEINDVSTLDEKGVRYCNSGIYYKRKIKESVNSDNRAKNYLINYMMQQAGSDDYKIITLMFKYIYLKGDTKALQVYQDIMYGAGFDAEEFNNGEHISELKCPYCKGKLAQRYGQYGVFVSCSNYPNCKFTFPI